ncbi:autophagy protein Apg5-domain-containing protein [Xylariomycetidae sp. FL2044]|nr:autophagy protein Apg5-domain-containing protein [Xylariomycetidae sp. FL2044]
MSAPISSSKIPQALWDLQVPLFITHADAPNTPFVTAVPRFGYLALLLPRLSTYFGLPCSSFHHEDVLLRNLAVGLLIDLYQPTLPWRLTVGEGTSWDIGDTFLNSAKEADFVRNGNAHTIMSLSKDNTTALWNAVQDNDYSSYIKVQSRLLNTSRELRNVPIRVYIPQTADDTNDINNQAGSFRVVQTLIQPRASERTPQTLGTALRTLLPMLFPSSRDPVLADVILHGARVPFGAPLEDLMREAAYPDGWICLVVIPLDV